MEKQQEPIEFISHNENCIFSHKCISVVYHGLLVNMQQTPGLRLESDTNPPSPKLGKMGRVNLCQTEHADPSAVDLET